MLKKVIKAIVGVLLPFSMAVMGLTIMAGFNGDSVFADTQKGFALSSNVGVWISNDKVDSVDEATGTLTLDSDEYSGYQNVKAGDDISSWFKENELFATNNAESASYAKATVATVSGTELTFTIKRGTRKDASKLENGSGESIVVYIPKDNLVPVGFEASIVFINSDMFWYAVDTTEIDAIKLKGKVQHEALGVVVAQMQIAMARQPEMSSSLLAYATSFVKAIAASSGDNRTYAIGNIGAACMDSIASQPEVAAKIMALANFMVASVNEKTIDAAAGISRMGVSSLQAIANQPEITTKLFASCKRFVRAYKDVSLAQVKIKKVKVGKKAIKVEFKAVTDASYYQVAVRHNGKWTKYNRTSVATRISGLTSGKKATVKVRAIYKSGEVSKTGAWSAAKSVKVK